MSVGKLYAIFIETAFQGVVPSVREGEKIAVFSCRRDAQTEIATAMIARLEQFLTGERDFDDAITNEEFVLEVSRLPDGSLRDEDGRVFC